MKSGDSSLRGIVNLSSNRPCWWAYRKSSYGRTRNSPPWSSSSQSSPYSLPRMNATNDAIEIGAVGESLPPTSRRTGWMASSRICVTTPESRSTRDSTSRTSPSNPEFLDEPPNQSFDLVVRRNLESVVFEKRRKRISPPSDFVPRMFQNLFDPISYSSSTHTLGPSDLLELIVDLPNIEWITVPPTVFLEQSVSVNHLALPFPHRLQDLLGHEHCFLDCLLTLLNGTCSNR